MSGSELPYLKAPRNTSGTYPLGTAVEARSEEYEYSPLQENQVRFLKITIDPRTSFLVCGFEVRDLTSSRGEYIAISYRWGDPRPTHRILVDNGGFLAVTESATEILRFVVSRHPSHGFWIDQLCINQTDLEEKSVQVSMMAQIYSSPLKVVAWLGQGDKSTRRAVTFVQKHSAEIEKRKAQGIQPTIPPLTSSVLPFRDRNWDSLTMLLRNPWFERVWVMQEVIMACSATSRVMEIGTPVLLMFGDCAVEFDVLASFLRVLESEDLASNLAYVSKVNNSSNELLETPFGIHAVRVFSNYRKIKERQDDISMNLALHDTWHFKASNDRDKIFATMGFVDADEIANTGLHPNYKSSVEEVYTHWATAMLRRDEEYPMLLHMAGVGLSRSYPALPSWVPDFSQDSQKVHLSSEVSRSEKAKSYCASGINKKTELDIDPSTQSLHCRGIFIDVVETVYNQPELGKVNRWYQSFTSSLIPFTPEKTFYKQFFKWLEDIETFLSASTTSNSRDILYQTIVGDYSIPPDSSDFNLGETFDSWYQAHSELASSSVSSYLASLKRKPDFLDKLERFDSLKASSLEDRPVFGTREKRMLGHGPMGLKAGDIICIIKGALTPFLLRPARSESELDGGGDVTYQLVGSCFVHGIMYGEGLNIGQLEDIVLV